MIAFTTVVVTYADRGHLLAKVVSAAIDAGSDHVIIIDNGSAEASKKIIDELPSLYHSTQFTIHTNEKNEGSAIAFSSGMDIASSDKNKNEMVLFLDDDNYPEDGSVQKALQYAEASGDSKMVLFLMREDRPHYREYVRSRDMQVLLGKENSFMAFTLKDYLNKFKEKIFGKGKSQELVYYPFPLMPVPCGPYGGMLTKKSILMDGVRPMKEMVLYFDDTKYTYDLDKSGVSLYIIPECIIRDIDDSWSAKKTSKLSSPLFEADEFKVSHTIRNRVYLERQIIVTNKFSYALNIASFMSITLIKAITSGNLMRYFKLIGYIRKGFSFGK